MNELWSKARLIIKLYIRRWLCIHRWGMEHSYADTVQCTRCGKERRTSEWLARDIIG